MAAWFRASQAKPPLLCRELPYKLTMITIWTHKINGLTESDFVLAAKADNLMA
jgi:pterin-4a-carbinolamine dehydratase